MGAKADLEDKCDILASRYYRRKTPYCEAAGKDSHVCDGQLQWCHIVSRRNRRLRYEPYNHVIMDHNVHRYYTERPLEWERFVRNNFPERWREVQAHRNEYQRVNASFYEEWMEKFRN